jgi:hypothetical protein
VRVKVSNVFILTNTEFPLELSSTKIVVFLSTNVAMIIFNNFGRFQSQS